MNYITVKKLTQLRAEMEKAGVDAFLIPQTDEYLGEYIPDCSQRLTWLTGFSGSAGIGIVTSGKACVMSDGRYTIQLAQQIDLLHYEAVNSQEVTPDEWLSKNTTKEMVIGYDPKIHTPHFIEKLEESGWILKATATNLIDVIWNDQPAPPVSNSFLFDESFAGQSTEEKIKLLQDFLTYEKCDATLLTQSDSIAWLLNIRGNDLPYIPVVLSYLILPKVGKAQWFVDYHKLNNDVRNKLNSFVDFLPIDLMGNSVENLAGKTVWYDPKRSSIYFKNLFQRFSVTIFEGDDPVIYPRACKNIIEQKAMKSAHLRDGIAMVRFLKWFDENKEQETLDELIVEKKLENFRQQAEEYREPSFNTISGYGSNGAIVHYRADTNSNKKIKKGNLLLLDSGAQYVDGTTDITRTIAVGEPTGEMIKCNTLVLKGHIALASAQFKKETLAKELDKLARNALVAEGLNYAHGTGHGVGCYLSVHEEASSLSPRGEKSMGEGMIVSNEPGYYKEGEFGIRIENLILTKEKNDDDFYFETITLCPIDKRLIDKSLLEEREVEWLNNYHQDVFDALASYLNQDEINWLAQATAAL